MSKISDYNPTLNIIKSANELENIQTFKLFEILNLIRILNYSPISNCFWIFKTFQVCMIELQSGLLDTLDSSDHRHQHHHHRHKSPIVIILNSITTQTSPHGYQNDKQPTSPFIHPLSVQRTRIRSSQRLENLEHR